MQPQQHATDVEPTTSTCSSAWSSPDPLGASLRPNVALRDDSYHRDHEEEDVEMDDTQLLAKAHDIISDIHLPDDIIMTAWQTGESHRIMIGVEIGGFHGCHAFSVKGHTHKAVREAVEKAYKHAADLRAAHHRRNRMCVE
mmetsp:Transcript_25401/g.73360  ORF Transcript_25401/g.73360 Transcript_25401/m.73360 type:complete len:141 (+) Transcript_25401:122-544(+)